jgi:DNA-binding NarL/FixJ family response regulator
MTLRIILADDQQKVRFALRVLLESRPDVEIVGEVEDAYDLIDQLPRLSPSVIILDWLLPGLTEIGSIRAIRELCPDIHVVALSGRPELGQEALANGVDTFVSKIDPPDRLQETLDQLVVYRIPSEAQEEPQS